MKQTLLAGAIVCGSFLVPTTIKAEPICYIQLETKVSLDDLCKKSSNYNVNETLYYAKNPAKKPVATTTKKPATTQPTAQTRPATQPQSAQTPKMWRPPSTRVWADLNDYLPKKPKPSNLGRNIVNPFKFNNAPAPAKPKR